MSAACHLVLIGLRGSGKSTLGAALATRQGIPFLDLDDETAAALGCDSVAAAWKEHGEAAFRAAETRCLREALARPIHIIALGGGTPTAPGAANLLRDATSTGRSVIAYLRADPALLRARLSAEGEAAMANRPSLTGKDPLDEIETIYAARDPLYRSIATRVIEGVDTLETALTRLEEWRTWRA